MNGIGNRLSCLRINSIYRVIITFVLLLGNFAVSVFASPGGWDQSYGPTIAGGPVNALALQPDGRLLVGGAFTSVNGSLSRNHLARLFTDGSLDTTFFNTGNGVSSVVYCLALQTDGRIVLGGDFTSINGTARTRVARLNSNGTVDGSFVPTNTLNGQVLALAVQNDNKVVIGGNFSGGAFPSWNARLNADGTVDTAFSSYPNGSVNAIAIQTNGQILIGGSFTTVNGAPRYRIARLNADGSIDNTFQYNLTGASAAVRCIQIQPDGKILVGGDFGLVNNTARGNVARLNYDGSLDTGFSSNPGANGPVYALVAQTDNSVAIAGNFSSYASFNLSHVARLYADGTRDTAFSTPFINGLVMALGVQSDGGILVGGPFGSINGTNRPYLARLYGNLYPPEFINQPISRSTNVGATVTFSASVNNPTPSSFQWRKEGNNIPNATGMSYTLYNVQFADSGNYSVFVSNGAGGTTSSNAVLQVGIAPAITSQPSSLIVTQAQSANFSVTATGTSLNYFWKKDGRFISGQTNSSIIFATVVPANAATYTCQVSNFLGSITSTGAVLTVVYPPTISVQPVSQTIGVGSNFTVNVMASGYPAVVCQWRQDGMSIGGASNASYSVVNAQPIDAGSYDVIITNVMGSVTSSVANIGVATFSPIISQQPTGGNIPVGNSLILAAAASGTAPLSWQWVKDGTRLTNGAIITTNLIGDTTFAYTNVAAQLVDAGSYWLVVNNSAGSATSSVAQVNVGYAPVVVQQPLSLTGPTGSTVALSCNVTGTVPINLQWLLNSNPLPDATNAILNITNLQRSNIGLYSLTATNLFGGTISSNAALNLAGYNFSSQNRPNTFMLHSIQAGSTTDIDNLRVVDLDTGAVVYTNSFSMASDATNKLNLFYYPQGGDDPANFVTNGPMTRIVNGQLRLETTGFGANGDGGYNSHSEAEFTDSLPHNFLVDFDAIRLQWAGTFDFKVFCRQPSDSLSSYDPNGGAFSTNRYPPLRADTLLISASGNWFDGYGLTTNVGFSEAWALHFDPPSADLTGTHRLGISLSNSIASFYLDGVLLNSGDISNYLVDKVLILSGSLGVEQNFNLSLNGMPWQSYVLQSASDLTSPIHWQSVVTNTTDTDGNWQYTETNLNAAQKFYRIITP